MQIDFRLQTFCAMRQSASVITIQNFFFHDLNEFRKVRRHQLFRRVKRNISFNKSSSSSKQLIIENLIEE